MLPTDLNAVCFAFEYFDLNRDGNDDVLLLPCLWDLSHRGILVFSLGASIEIVTT